MKLNQTMLAAMLAVALIPPASHATGVAASLYPGQVLPSGGIDTPCEISNQMISADFNGDGIADIATGDWESACADADGNPIKASGVWVWLGKADSSYSTPVFYQAGNSPAGIVALDLNGDSKPDIVTGNAGLATSGQISVLINKGDGTFETHHDYSPDTSVTWGGFSVAGGDINGDGDADIVLVGGDGAAYVLAGNGDGTLDDNNVDVQKLPLGGSGWWTSIAIADINGDQTPDLVVTDSAHVNVFLGHGGGPFSATPDQQLPLTTGSTYASIAAGDVNEDHRTDIVASSYSTGSVYVLLNDNGSLVKGNSYTLPTGVGPFPIQLTDIDGDGHLDMFAPDDNCEGDSNYVLYGNGDGSFVDPDPVPMGVCSYSGTIVDAASGLPDLIAGNVWSRGQVTRARNLGNRKFYTYASYPYASVDDADMLHGYYAYDMAVSDFNGDGSPDAVTANDGDNSFSVLLGDGHGGFKDPTIHTLPAGNQLNAIAVADINDDGKADVIAPASNSGILYVYLGDGAGGFASTPTTSSINSDLIDGIAIGDIDGDGKLDAVMAENATGVQICKGTDPGQFDCTAYGLVAVTNPSRVALQDLDKDGHLDLVVTSTHSNGTDYESYVYLGDGKGAFTPSDTLTSGSATVHDDPWGLAVGDIDEDGKPDIVLGTEGRYAWVFDGNGDGTFGSGTAVLTGNTDYAEPWFLTLADVNGDGHLDLVAANDNEASIGVLLGKGDTTFNAPLVLTSGYYVFPVAVVDMDGDGQPDIVSANYGDGNNLISSTVSVYLHNHAPTVQGLDLKTDQDTPVSGTLKSSDDELNAVKFAVATQPAHGKLSDVDESAGTFTYTPASGFSGEDSFTFTASDGLNLSPAGTVNVTVTAVTPPPPDDSGDGDTGGTTTPVSSPSGGGGGGLGLLSLLGLVLCALRRKAAG